MWSISRRRLTVVLISTFFSIYSVTFFSSQGRPDRDHVRAKRQIFAYNDTAFFDTSSIITEPETSSSEVSVYYNTASTETTDSTFIYQSSNDLFLDMSSSDSNFIDTSTTSLPDLDVIPSHGNFIDQYVTALTVLDFTDSTFLDKSFDSIFIYEVTSILQSEEFSLDKSSTIFHPNLSPSDISLFDESATVSQSDIFSLDSDVLDTSSTVLDSNWFSSDVSLFDESATVSQSDIFSLDSDVLDSSSTVLDSNWFSSDVSLFDESATVSQSDIFSLDSDVLDTSSTVLDSNWFSSDVSLFDESAIVSQSDIFSLDSDVLDTSSTVLDSNWFSSDVSLFDESATVSQSDIFSLDSDVLDTSSTVLDSNWFSSDVSLFDESATVSQSDIFPLDSDSFYPSATDFSEDSFLQTDELTVMPTTVTMEIESTLMVIETLPFPATEYFESAASDSDSTESSLQIDHVSESVEVNSLDSLYSSDPTLEYPLESSMSADFSFPVYLTGTPVATHDTQTYPTALTEESTSIYTLGASSITPSSSDSMEDTVFPPSTTPSNNTGVVPDKSTLTEEGLSTGGKVAIGILIPVAVICLILFGLFFYRRYCSSRRSLKTFMHPGVRYRTYSNAAYKEDEVAVDGSWRSLSDH